MLVAFTLTMPNVGSWNGKWTGDAKLYCVVRSFTGKKGLADADKLIDAGHWHYSWGDGWGASIEAKAVDSRTAGKLRRKSSGFYGYEWMIDTICMYGTPLATHEIQPFLQKQEAATVAAT